MSRRSGLRKRLMAKAFALRERAAYEPAAATGQLVSSCALASLEASGSYSCRAAVSAVGWDSSRGESAAISERGDCGVNRALQVEHNRRLWPAIVKWAGYGARGRLQFNPAQHASRQWDWHRVFRESKQSGATRTSVPSTRSNTLGISQNNPRILPINFDQARN